MQCQATDCIHLADTLQGFTEGARVARISGSEGMQLWPFWVDVEVTQGLCLLWPHNPSYKLRWMSICYLPYTCA